MPLISDKIKMISCSDFRLFLKRLIKDKIEKEWTEDHIDNLNLVIFPRSTIKRRNVSSSKKYFKEKCYIP